MEAAMSRSLKFPVCGGSPMQLGGANFVRF